MFSIENSKNSKKTQQQQTTNTKIMATLWNTPTVRTSHKATHLHIGIAARASTRNGVTISRKMMSCIGAPIPMSEAEAVSMVQHIPPGELKRRDDEFRRGWRSGDLMLISAALLAPSMGKHLMGFQ
jgi:hypothetical protein